MDFDAMWSVQYTSIAASEQHVVLGANTGGVYCFSSTDLRYLRLLAHKVAKERVCVVGVETEREAVVCGDVTVAVRAHTLLCRREGYR